MIVFGQGLQTQEHVRTGRAVVVTTCLPLMFTQSPWTMDWDGTMTSTKTTNCQTTQKSRKTVPGRRTTYDNYREQIKRAVCIALKQTVLKSALLIPQIQHGRLKKSTFTKYETIVLNKFRRWRRREYFKKRKKEILSLVRLSHSTYFAFFYMLNYNLKGF